MLGGKEPGRCFPNPGVSEEWALHGLVAACGNRSFVLNFMWGESLLLPRAGHTLLA